MELAGHGPGGGRRFSGLDGENKRECRILDLILDAGGDSGNRLQHIAVRNKKPPACAEGSSLHSWGNLPTEQQQ